MRTSADTVARPLGVTATPARLCSDAHTEGFAQAYLGQQQAPFNQWVIGKAFTTFTITVPSTALLNAASVPPLSAQGIQVIAGAGPTVPVSFGEADGTVLRVAKGDGVVLAWNPDGATIPAIRGIYPETGRKAAQAATLLATAPLKAVHVNTLQNAYAAQLWLEVPTINMVTPSTFNPRVEQTLQILGGGFGAGAGKIWIGAATYPTSLWTDNQIRLTLPANTLGAGTVPVRVEHAAGVVSNLFTITAN